MMESSENPAHLIVHIPRENVLIRREGNLGLQQPLQDAKCTLVLKIPVGAEGHFLLERVAGAQQMGC